MLIQKHKKQRGNPVPWVITSISVDPNLIETFDIIALEEGVTRSQLMRFAMQSFVDEYLKSH